MTEWISVKDRLPEDDGFYLVYTTDGFVSEWQVDEFYLDTNYGWIGERFAPDWKVTHWMPLPELPQVNNG